MVKIYGKEIIRGFPRTAIEAVINNKLSSIYYDHPAKKTGSEIKSPYTNKRNLEGN